MASARGQVALHLLAYGLADRLLATDGHRDGTAGAGVIGPDGGRGVLDLGLCALEVDDDQSGVAGAVAQQRHPSFRPVGDHSPDVLLRRQRRSQRTRGGGDGRVVDTAAQRVDDEDDLRIAGAQLLLEELPRLVRLRTGVVEPAFRQAGEDS